jgi:hypothetical protein
MERQTLTFKTEYRAFGYVFAALVTLCTLPVTAWHYWQTLEGFALLGIGGWPLPIACYGSLLTGPERFVRVS